MAKVYITRVDAPPKPTTWAFRSVVIGRPGLCEASGFTSVREARAWAKKWGHEVVTLRREVAK